MHEYPNIWPQDGLFAFSGVDGETCRDEPFVARGTRDSIGWFFDLKPIVALRAVLGAEPLKSVLYPTDYCLADCWHCTVTPNELRGYVQGAFIDRASLAVVISFDRLPENQAPHLAAEEPGQTKGDTTVFAGESAWLAVSAGPLDAQRHFGVAVSYNNEAEAIARAQAARKADLDEVIRKRLAFYRGFEPPESMAGNRRRTFYKAISILKSNVHSADSRVPCRWTTPVRSGPSEMRLLDSAIHSTGFKHLHLDLAEEALNGPMSQQDEEGRLHLGMAAPTPEDHEAAHTPIAAWAFWHQFETYRRVASLKSIYPKLVRYVDWFESQRRNANGLFGWRLRPASNPLHGARGIESGMDNSPRFDIPQAMTAVDLSSFMAGEYLVLEKMAKWLEKPAEAEEWARRWRRTADLINELLWDDEDTFYYDLDDAGEFIPVMTNAGFLPLYSRVPDRNRAEALRMHLMNPKEFRTPVRVPSVSLGESSFSSNMWRGPAWLSHNLLIYYGLMSYGFFQEAREIAHNSIAEVVRCYLLYGCFYEYYDVTSTDPPFALPRLAEQGAHEDVASTAAAFLDFIYEVQ